MIRKLLSLFGYTIVYRSNWGTHTYRYDGTDRGMGRPIHRDMGVAPPWATRHFVRLEDDPTEQSAVRDGAGADNQAPKS